MNLTEKESITLFKMTKIIFLSSWKFLISFITIYNIIGQVFIVSIFEDLIDFTIKKIGYSFLNTTILVKWLIQPTTIFILIICAIILGIYIVFEMSTVILYINYIAKGEKIGWKECIKESIKRTSKILLPKNWTLLIFIIIVFPFTFLSFNFSMISEISIPEFIIDFIKSNTSLLFIYWISMVLLNIFSCILLFSIPFFIIESKSFKESIKESIILIKKHFKYIFSRYILGMLFLWIISLLIIFILFSLPILKMKYLDGRASIIENFMDYYIILKMYSLFFFKICKVIVSFLLITAIYIKVYNKEFIKIEKKKTPLKEIIFIIACIIVFLPILGIYIDYKQPASAYFNKSNNTNEIIAHRAGGNLAPENTVESLRQSIKNGISYAEIDVQETKDGELIVCHDENLKRIAGINKNVWDLNYEDIKEVDIGSKFSTNYTGAKITTLSQMIKEANGKINLMIEIKQNGHSDNIVPKVLKEIEKNNFTDQCSIASMDLGILKEVKEINPKVDTVYITPAIYGNYYSLEYVDAFSIEASFVNNSTVNLVHAYKKKIYIWTVNKKSNIERALRLKANGVITDDPILVKNLKHRNLKNIMIENLFSLQ